LSTRVMFFVLLFPPIGILLFTGIVLSIQVVFRYFSLSNWYFVVNWATNRYTILYLFCN
jgi:hypothetical protein